MGRVLLEIGKHFLAIGLAIIAFALVKFGLEGSIKLSTAIVGVFLWLSFITLGSILIYVGGKHDGD